jgi:hypothetical protein
MRTARRGVNAVGGQADGLRSKSSKMREEEGFYHEHPTTRYERSLAAIRTNRTLQLTHYISHEAARQRQRGTVQIRTLSSGN